MIYAKNYEKLSKFVTITAKILSARSPFPDAVYFSLWAYVSKNNRIRYNYNTVV